MFITLFVNIAPKTILAANKKNVPWHILALPHVCVSRHVTSGAACASRPVGLL